jgi:hypothetical protein
MVKITFKSWKEVVVHEVIKYESLEAFIEQKIIGVPKGVPIEPFLWANGLLFIRVPMPPTSDIIKEQLRGIIHLSVVEYAHMAKYEKSITQSEVTIPIINVCGTRALRDMAKAIKRQENK